jgi:hypothetical protein
MKHIAVVPMVIKAFLVSAMLQIPFMLMQITGTRSLVIGSISMLYFVPSILLERLPPTFHLFRNTRKSTMLSYLIEVYTFQFVMMSAVIFGIPVVAARSNLTRNSNRWKTPE